MKRRDFVRSVGAGGALVGAAAASSSFPAPAIAPGVKQFKMVTTWPKNVRGLGPGAERLAERIPTMAEGRVEGKVFPAGELVPPFQSFDAVSAGNAEMAHSASYYWQGKSPGFNFFTSVPFGLAPMERLPMRDASVDLIVAHGIWNLASSSSQFRAAVREAARVARPGAALFVFTFSRTTIGPDGPHVIRIADTGRLREMQVSEALARAAGPEAGWSVTGDPVGMEFDSEGNLKGTY